MGTAINVARAVVQIVLKTINPAAKSSTPSYLLPNNQYPSSQTWPILLKPLINIKAIIKVAKNKRINKNNNKSNNTNNNNNATVNNNSKSN